MYKVDSKTGIHYFDDSDVRLINATMPISDEDGVLEVEKYMNDYGLALEGRECDYENPMFVSEFAGRHCYMSFGKKAGKKSIKDYIENIIKLEHFSVLEHMQFVFVFRGVGRSFSHEVVRHRHLSISQFSTRYCDEIKFVLPVMIRGNKNLELKFLYFCYNALKIYNEIFEEVYEMCEGTKTQRRKTARGCARSALPIGCEAPIILSGNLRTWLEIIKKRCYPAAEHEIQNAIGKVKDILYDNFGDIIGWYLDEIDNRE